MIPLAHVLNIKEKWTTNSINRFADTWLREPLTSKVTNDFLNILEAYIKEATERNRYGDEVLNYAFNHECDELYRKELMTHPHNEYLISKLPCYDETEKIIILTRNSRIHVEFSETCNIKEMKFTDGLYKNDIILFNE